MLNVIILTVILLFLVLLLIGLIYLVKELNKIKDTLTIYNIKSGTKKPKEPASSEYPTGVTLLNEAHDRKVEKLYG